MNSIPLAVAVSGANRHDSLALKPLIRGIPAVRSRRGSRRRRPVKLRADKGVGGGLAQRSTWPFGDTAVSAAPTAGSARLDRQRREIVRHVLSGCVGLVRRFREGGEDEPRGELPADLVCEGVAVFKRGIRAELRGAFLG